MALMSTIQICAEAYTVEEHLEREQARGFRKHKYDPKIVKSIQ
jgi:hypothetical protein